MKWQKQVLRNNKGEASSERDASPFYNPSKQPLDHEATHHETKPRSAVHLALGAGAAAAVTPS